MTTPTIDIVPLDAPLGAEVRGLDLTADPDGDDVFALLDAFRRHHVLVVRSQPIDDERLRAVASWFGSPYIPPADIPMFGDEDQGLVSVLSNRDDAGVGSRIPLPHHTDLQYMPIPLLGAALHSVRVPPEGGDTLWSNLHQAYDELDDATKQRLEGLRGIALNPFAGQGLGREFTGDGQHFVEHEVPDFPHPLVRTHPDTGRKALYMSSFIIGIDGIDDPDDEQQLIGLLNAHVDQDHLYYRHQWQEGDTIIWDNRCTNHKREDFDQSYPREMHRVQIAGTRPF
ncbi:MAG: TauD/TfdA family dioxygenase [Acidimicrobiia bacterium]|nr:TauD/TfdA family dioxygenase [Acidimicrobiia bacterium]